MRKWNFSAGPAAIPQSVLQDAQAEMLEWKDSGMSVMEMSHRSPEYIDIANKARQDFIDLLKIPSDYQVLFLQGGATLQFSMVPMNFGAKSVADYVLSGSWSKKAINEASKIIDINIVATSAPIPPNKAIIIVTRNSLSIRIPPKLSPNKPKRNSLV